MMEQEFGNKTKHFCKRELTKLIVLNGKTNVAEYFPAYISTRQLLTVGLGNYLFIFFPLFTEEASQLIRHVGP